MFPGAHRGRRSFQWRKGREKQSTPRAFRFLRLWHLVCWSIVSKEKPLPGLYPAFHPRTSPRPTAPRTWVGSNSQKVCWQLAFASRMVGGRTGTAAHFLQIKQKSFPIPSYYCQIWQEPRWENIIVRVIKRPNYLSMQITRIQKIGRSELTCAKSRGVFGRGFEENERRVWWGRRQIGANLDFFCMRTRRLFDQYQWRHQCQSFQNLSPRQHYRMLLCISVQRCCWWWYWGFS